MSELVKKQLEEAKELMNKAVDHVENELTKIREAQSVEDIIGVKELMHDEKMRQEAIQTQQEFFPKDAGKSSTLLDHILGELQKVNQSGIEIKGRGINDVQLSQEPTSNAFEN